MRFWYSGELDEAIFDDYRPIRQHVERVLNEALSSRDYGATLEKIAIVPVIVGPRFAKDRVERRLIKHKEKVADYRLFIDFEAFLKGDETERIRLLVCNTLDAVQDIDRKLKGAFNGKQLCADIHSLFSETRDAR